MDSGKCFFLFPVDFTKLAPRPIRSISCNVYWTLLNVVTQCCAIRAYIFWKSYCFCLQISLDRWINYKKMPYRKNSGLRTWNLASEMVLNCPVEKSWLLLFANHSVVHSGWIRLGEGPWLWLLALVIFDRWQMTWKTGHVTPDFFFFYWVFFCEEFNFFYYYYYFYLHQ